MTKILIFISLFFPPVDKYLTETRKNAHELTYLQQNNLPKHHKLVPVSVTMYNAVVEQTDDTPFITASMDTIHMGVVALSRDLEKKFKFKFGDQIFIEGIKGPLIFKDRMNKRYTNSIDIYSPCEIKAKKFGRQQCNLIIYKEG